MPVCRIKNTEQLPSFWYSLFRLQAVVLIQRRKFVRAYAKEYGINEENIAVMGFSAGGILAGEMLLNFDGTVSPAVLDADYALDWLDEIAADTAADGMIYSFYGRLSVGTTDVELLCSGNPPPTFYGYGTRDPFYRQFLANADAAEEAGVPVMRLQLDGMPHGFGAQGGWIPIYAEWLENIFTGILPAGDRAVYLNGYDYVVLPGNWYHIPA